MDMTSDTFLRFMLIRSLKRVPPPYVWSRQVQFVAVVLFSEGKLSHSVTFSIILGFRSYRVLMHYLSLFAFVSRVQFVVLRCLCLCVVVFLLLATWLLPERGSNNK
jgi:hypothetical protein